jgi:hypothetical protein
MQAVSAEAALILVISDQVKMDQLTCGQLEEISRGGEWDLQVLPDTELLRVASGDLVPSRRSCRGKRPG